MPEDDALTMPSLPYGPSRATSAGVPPKKPEKTPQTPAQRPTIPEQVTAAREARGLSQAELGAMIGVGQGMISRLESGKHAPTVETLKKLSTALGTALLVYPDQPNH
jgi:HTH-type transcriptional regulator / antitoxin HipB